MSTKSRRNILIFNFHFFEAQTLAPDFFTLSGRWQIRSACLCVVMDFVNLCDGWMLIYIALLTIRWRVRRLTYDEIVTEYNMLIVV